ncbi:hypothetical protein PHK61_24130 [Actinomycetospora lutea]|uniref:hypothetical protein n=1 Tax=Actinomycetospora lutea TaxID=663604 RepID=UPI00236516DC|nr:hypothetical protein [Actinomycetospora lutea]MDD7941515.1 hypothetical protein [Actinomycetospora lutea]
MASDQFGGHPPMISDAVADWCDDVFRIYGEVLDSQRRLTVALIRSAAPVLDVGERAGEKAAEGAERLSATVQARRAGPRDDDRGAAGSGGGVPRITDAPPAREEDGPGSVPPVGGEIDTADAGDEEIADVLAAETDAVDVADDLEAERGGSGVEGGEEAGVIGDPEAVTEAATETDPGTDPETGAETDSGTDSGTGSGTDTGTDTELDESTRPASTGSKGSNGSPRRRSSGAKRPSGSSRPARRATSGSRETSG